MRPVDKDAGTVALSSKRMVQVHAVHALAWLAIRTLPPLRAKTVVAATVRVGRFAGVKPLGNANEAQDAMRSLGGWGTCLSRALAVSTLLPGSHVAIGVDNRHSAGLSAHAWVEVNGEPLEGTQPSEIESARGVELEETDASKPSMKRMGNL